MQINKSGDAPPPASPKGNRETGPVPRENVDEFQRLYRRPEGGASEQGRSGGPAGDQPEELENLSAIFSSLLSGAGNSAPSVPSGPVQTPEAGVVDPAARELNELVSGLVERILTSPLERGGPQEVRLLVNDGLLPDTEILLSRGLDGLLSVNLVAGRADSFQTLVAAQDSLRTALSGLENNEVRLTVTGAGAGAGEAASLPPSRAASG
jgi:type III secretion system needle length determinant